MAYTDTARTDQIPPYYSRISDQNGQVRFRDFDDKSTFDEYAVHVESASSRNFVIDFGAKEAWAAFNVGQCEINNLLASEARTCSRPATLPTRWINIWAPELQKDLVKSIGLHYDFSPRLLGSMCSEPLKPMPIPPNQHISRLHGLMNLHRERGDHREVEEKSILDGAADLEGRVSSSEQRSISSTRPSLDLNHYRIVDDVWHFSSVDWGRNFLCIGYNSLHQYRGDTSSGDNCKDEFHVLPAGKRVWTWLILCGDGTTISVHENPFPGQQGVLEREQNEILCAIRRNLLNVFGQLSRASGGQRERNPIMTLPIRGSLTSLEDGIKDGRPTSLGDDSSLLFYYLFDDWYTSYSLVARKEHQYSAQLEDLRKDMFQKAELDHIERLHGIGRQLAVLKRIYQSYDRIISRILERQNLVISELHAAASADPNADRDDSVIAMQASTGDIRSKPYLGVALSAPTIVRFERLKDNINLYALSEIQACLDEKESLVFLNFNLLSIKESHAVERLTRITILLAKLTILFLPVSLMTGYFSVQIADLQGVYTHTTYWVSFAVIMGLSFIFLLVFGYLSGTVEGRPIYRSLTQTFMDFSKGAIGYKKKKTQ